MNIEAYHRSRLLTPGDGIRLITRAVGIPDNFSRAGVKIPPLEASADVTIEVGNSVDRYLGVADNIICNTKKEGFASIDPNLVAYWIFDGGVLKHMQSALEADTQDQQISSTRQFTLTKNGNPTISDLSPQDGYGITFDGTGDYLSLANVAGNGLDITTGDFSIMVVLKVAATTAKMILLSKRADAGSDGVGYDLQIDATNSKAFITIEDADQAVTHSGKTAIDDDKIHMIHVTVDRDGDTNVYLDGAVDNLADTAGDLTDAEKTISNTDDFQIGADNATTPANLLTGTIYQVAVWNNVRSANDIKNDFYGGFAPIIDPADGNDLVVCGSADDPGFYDLTNYLGGAKVARAVCSAAQTGGNELYFDFVFRG